MLVINGKSLTQKSVGGGSEEHGRFPDAIRAVAREVLEPTQRFPRDGSFHLGERAKFKQ